MLSSHDQLIWSGEVHSPILCRCALRVLQVYRLPIGETSRFAPLLGELERQQTALGIGHFAVSMPTLVSGPLS